MIKNENLFMASKNFWYHIINHHRGLPGFWDSENLDNDKFYKKKSKTQVSLKKTAKIRDVKTLKTNLLLLELMQ